MQVSDLDRFLFIVGAPRCGTTTLSQFLKDHPSVSFPLTKEPHFFAQHDLRALSIGELTRRVEREYLGRFFRSKPGRRIGVDASVTYLYVPEQLEPILRLWPNSRFVIALRDPLTMLPSLHRRLIYIGDETIRRFAEAWAAVPDRAAGRRIPRGCADPRWLRYDEAGRFGTYLERLFAVVGRERCQVVIFDDLADDTVGQYRRLLDFAGLPLVPRTDFSPRRAGQCVRSRWLQRLLKRPPQAVRDYLAGEQYRLHICNHDEAEPLGASKILSLRKRLLAWNRMSLPPEALPIPLQNEIRLHLKSEMDRLSVLLERDLGHWLLPGLEGRAVGASKEGDPTRGTYRAAFSR